MYNKLAVGLALLAIQVGWLKLPWFVAIGLTCCIYLASGGWRFVRLLWLTLPRDIRFLSRLTKVQMKLNKALKNNWTACDLFQETSKKHKEKVAFIFEDRHWTFHEVEMFSNKVANYFQSIGYKKGDVVALFIENRPELVFFWLGLAKIGVVSSLVNYNLRKDSLLHCITIVNAKGLIYSTDASISDAITDISSSLNGIELFEFGLSAGLNDLKSKNVLEKLIICSGNPPTLVPEISCKDVLFYIYTSGTTGLPKASIIKHSKFLAASLLVQLMECSVNDVLYCVLPLYHTSGGMLGVGGVFRTGLTLVVRRKFSASCFWDECIHYKATGAIYIGELCRYLVAQPPKDSEKKHSLRFMAGNGLRPQIWNELKARSNVPSIIEFYGATEGNIFAINLDGRPGAIGYYPPTFPAQLFPIQIFKMNTITGELLRGANGQCIPCNPGETGQIAGRINAERPFDGYLNKQANEKKIAHDVLKKGDKWFLSGDMVYWDELGYVYFKDRMGDTFRWRGENVSTTEVEGAILKALGPNCVIVYGVEIPGCEGRAGMAAIEDPDGVVDLKILGKKLSEVLPSYAIPIFLRITNSVDTTGTFKFQKGRFKKEGFDPSVVKDKLFYFDAKLGEYCALTKEIYGKFLDGEMRI